MAEGYTNFDDLLNHFLELKASRDEKFDLDLALDEFITFFIAGYIFYNLIADSNIFRICCFFVFFSRTRNNSEFISVLLPCSWKKSSHFDKVLNTKNVKLQQFL